MKYVAYRTTYFIIQNRYIVPISIRKNNNNIIGYFKKPYIYIRTLYYIINIHSVYKYTKKRDVVYYTEIKSFVIPTTH